jgi:hypothetical protein
MAKKLNNSHFHKMMDEQRKHVIERLQMFGDFPQCDLRVNCASDWSHILIEATGDLFEQLRFDESDPEVCRDILRRLALIAVICQEWARCKEEE